MNTHHIQLTTIEVHTMSQVKLTAAQQKKYDTLTTKSARIRMLDTLGYSRSEIAKSMEILYQHVRNVLITPVAKPKQ